MQRFCNIAALNKKLFSPCGGIGRRSRLKICHSQGCEGSIPFVGTFFLPVLQLKTGFFIFIV